MQSVKISSIKTMTASEDNQIQINCLLDFDFLVSNLDESSFKYLAALTAKRLADDQLDKSKKEMALSRLGELKSILNNQN